MGRNTQAAISLLREYESRNITFTEPDGAWPIVWERAKGMEVWDVEGRRYLDWTAAFGVAAAGHANLRVVRAGKQQMAKLLHAMGDVHPHALKGELARELSRITFERWTGQGAGPWSARQGKVIFCNSGFEAVEAALKTALLASGKRGVLAFAGGYHGLGYGALEVTPREHFRARFTRQLGQFAEFAPFPAHRSELAGVLELIETKIDEGTIGAVLIEPMQARGGIKVPPPGFLAQLQALCNRRGMVLILDEIYTGFGRTGAWFACEHEHVVPDLICLGKALTGGFPMSACVGRSDLMDAAWPPATGEAIHTSTFLGHPVGCAMALAQVSEIARLGLVPRAGEIGRRLLQQLAQMQAPRGLKLGVRGAGLMIGVELRRQDDQPAGAAVWTVIKRMLERGHILLPEGEFGNVLAFTPPLIVTARQVRQVIGDLEAVLQSV